MASKVKVSNCVVCGSAELKKGCTYCLKCASGIKVVCPQCDKPLVVAVKKYLAGQRRNPDRSWVHAECRSEWVKQGVWTVEKRANTGKQTDARNLDSEYREKHKEATGMGLRSEEGRLACSKGANKRWESEDERNKASTKSLAYFADASNLQKACAIMQQFWASDAGTVAKKKISDTLGIFWTEEQRRLKGEFLTEFYQTEEGIRAKAAMTAGRIELFNSVEGDLLRSRISQSVSGYAIYKLCCDAPDKDLSVEAIENMRKYWTCDTDTELIELHRDIYLNHLNKEYLENLIIEIRNNTGCCTRLDLSLATGFNYVTITRLFKGEVNLFDIGISKLQQEVMSYVATLCNSELQHSVRPDFLKLSNWKGQELDIYIPDLKLAIEVNGTYWHSEQAGKDKNYHYNKSKICRENGIRLIHVWEHEWNNPQQRKVLESIIKSALGITKTVYARKLEIEYRKSKDMRDFFTSNNIQGFKGGEFAICLVDPATKEVLLAYLIGKGSHFSRKYQYEVVRGASKLGYTVVGGTSKLFKHLFASRLDITNLVYYVDYNYFDGRSLRDDSNWDYTGDNVSFKNYFVKTGEVKNRNPGKHAEIVAGYKDGSILCLWNAGVGTYLYTRK